MGGEGEGEGEEETTPLKDSNIFLFMENQYSKS